MNRTRTIQAWAATHAGAIRAQNQDACLCRPEIGLFAVADGVGGQGDGAAASREVMAALDTIPPGMHASLRLSLVRSRLQEAHCTLRAMSEVPGSATTFVMLMMHEDHFVCLWAGDSRAYLLRDDELRCLTRDHSLVQDLIEAGSITEAQAGTDPRRHVITRAVGAGDADLKLDKATGRIVPGDRFLLCTDGLHKTIEAAEIVGLLGEPGDPASLLIETALSRRARDNVTVVIAGYSQPGSRAGDPAIHRRK